MMYGTENTIQPYRDLTWRMISQYHVPVRLSQLLLKLQGLHCLSNDTERM